MHYYGLTLNSLNQEEIKTKRSSKDVSGISFNSTELFGDKIKFVIREAVGDKPEVFIMKKDRRNITQTAFYAYEKSLGELTSIKDESGAETLSEWTLEEKTIDSEVFYVYSKEITGQKYFKVVR